MRLEGFDRLDKIFLVLFSGRIRGGYAGLADTGRLVRGLNLWLPIVLA